MPSMKKGIDGGLHPAGDGQSLGEVNTGYRVNDCLRPVSLSCSSGEKVVLVVEIMKENLFARTVCWWK